MCARARERRPELKHLFRTSYLNRAIRLIKTSNLNRAIRLIIH